MAKRTYIRSFKEKSGWTHPFRCAWASRDSKLPQTVYHTTKNHPAVEKEDPQEKIVFMLANEKDHIGNYRDYRAAEYFVFLLSFLGAEARQKNIFLHRNVVINRTPEKDQPEWLRGPISQW